MGFDEVVRKVFLEFAEFLGMGFYRVKEDGKFVEADSIARTLFGIPLDEVDLSKYSIADLLIFPAERKARNDEIRARQGKPLSEALSVRVDDEEKLLFEKRWYEENDDGGHILGLVSEFENKMIFRNYRALDRMPTGYYYVEYEGDKPNYKRQRIVQCNDYFAKILGMDNKDELIGRDVTEFHANKEEGQKYFKSLDKADKEGAPVLNYPLRLKRADNGQIVHAAIDAHLVKEHGKIIGREATIRDITQQVALNEQVEEAEKRYVKTTADINNLIHSFLHPVLKFSGHSELLQRHGNILYQSMFDKVLDEIDLRELGKHLEEKLIEVKAGLEVISDASDKAAILVPVFEKIINIFDYDLEKGASSKVLLEKAISDISAWVLEELANIDFFKPHIAKAKLREVVNDEFVELHQDILLRGLIQSAGVLKGETQLMKREVEAIRKYIGLKMPRKYAFGKNNLARILEYNIELFKPLFVQKEIGIEYNRSGNLQAEISENDIDRVVCNLFQNAYKYSHPGSGRFVHVRGREVPLENAIEFSIESYGIPIKKEEIESGAIFKFGFRGELVYHTDRDGTGVGLADAKEVIEAHNGEIEVTSEPAGSGRKSHNYKEPYLTTVTVKLPKKIPQGRS